MSDQKKKKLTNAAGVPVTDNTNVQTAGPRGPQMLQDVWYLEKLAHFGLGVNHWQIPVNRPRNADFNIYHRDGAMRVDGNQGGTPGYDPNSYGHWQESPELREPPLGLDGDVGHYPQDDDYFTQPAKLFGLMNGEERQRLFENTGRAMGDAPEAIKRKHIEHCRKADPAYGAGVAKALGLEG